MTVDPARYSASTSPAGASEAVRERVAGAVQALADELAGLSHGIHAAAEVGFEEHESVRLIARMLERHGVPAEVGVFGLETALHARVGQDGPTVAVLAEYDALPGIGHGCGHNIIAASAVGAFLGVAEAVADLGGSVVLLGCPAEENGGGKEIMARAGALDGVDAAVMLHPGVRDAATMAPLAERLVRFTYLGTPAHASAMPHEGRNALDAVVAAYQALAAMRQHIAPQERLHGVVTEGGTTTNVVPERASALFELRATTTDQLANLSLRVQRALEGAAMVTGTTLQVAWDEAPAYLPLRNNLPLADRYLAHLCERGRDVDPGTDAPPPGSTDMGNVSLRVPAIHPTLAVAPDDVAMHTADFARHAATADTAALDGAVGLALTMADYLADPRLRDAVAKAFADAGGAADLDAVLDIPTTPADPATPPPEEAP